MDWEFGISRCKLVCIEWVNKVLLYSTENYVQHPVINHNGKEYEKEGVCIYIYMPAVKETACSAGDVDSISGSGRSPSEEMATHASILAWEIPWTEEPCRLQSIGSQRV